MARSPKTEKPTKTKMKELCELYSLSQVAVALGCHRVSAYKWALEHGLIKRKRPYQYTNLPKKRQLSQLSSTMTDKQIADKLELSEAIVKARRHHFGIHRSRVRRRYTLNEQFFKKIDTEQKAYILGFLAADGTVADSGRCVVLMLHAKDEHILHEIREAMGSNARIFTREKIEGYPNRGPYKYVYFSSQELVRDLAKLGISQRKSFTLEYTKIPRHLEKHYLRGLLDGDGSIHRVAFYLLGTEELIDGARSAIEFHTGYLLSKTHEGKLFRITGCNPSKLVLHWLYKDATIFLKRKHQKFLDFWQ